MLPTYGTVLCAHGLEPHFPQVYRHASGLAQRYDGEVVVVHALEPLTSYAESMLDLYVPHEITEQMHQEAAEKIRRRIEGQLEQWEEDQLADGALRTARLREVRVRNGQPAEVLLEEARRVSADLLVMGCHRHTAVGELLLGSTAHRVMQRATLPVLLVRVSS